MRFRRRRSAAVSLWWASHPGAATVTSLAVTVAAAVSGRTPRECALVAITVFVGQTTVGWVDDLVDRQRDRQVGRQDRPLAMAWVDPGTVAFALAVATLAVVPLSVANGTIAGVAYLASLASLWLYHLWLKRSWCSWIPHAVAFALLPAFLSYGGWGGGAHGSPPTVLITGLAALVGVGVHVLGALPDLVADRQTGLHHLPLRIALRTGAARLSVLATALTVGALAGLTIAGFTTGLRQ